MMGRRAVAFVERWRRRLGAGRAERRVAEELRLHRELLFEDYRGRGLTAAEARRAADERFGDFEAAYARCVAIARRSGPAVKLLRASLPLWLTAGVWLRLCFAEARVAQLGNVLMAIAVLGHLLLRVREGARHSPPAPDRTPPDLHDVRPGA